MAWTIKDTNKDITREECVCDDRENLTISDEAKLHAWKEYYQRCFSNSCSKLAKLLSTFMKISSINVFILV